MESHESTRQRAEFLQSEIHEDRIAGKGFTSMTHSNLVHKFIPMPQGIKNPDAKSFHGQGMEVARDNCGMGFGKKNKVHIATLMDTCHLKNAELEPICRNTKAESCSRGDIVKDDSRAYAVFTGQGSSASQMTAAKIMDVVARLTGCDGQAADAVPAYTQVKLEDAPRLLKIPKSECPDVWIRLPRLKSWGKIRDAVVRLERNLYGHPLASLLWKRQFEEALSELGWEKIPNWECMFLHRKQGLFLSVYVDDIKMAGKKQNTAPMWKKLLKHVDIDEPTSFLDHAYLVCTLRECKPNETIVEQYTKMFESCISVGATEIAGMRKI